MNKGRQEVTVANEPVAEAENGEGGALSWAASALRDPSAFDALYSFYLPKVYAYVYSRLGTKQDSEDLVADVFLRVVHAIKSRRFENYHEHAFAAWLFTAARNLIIDRQRSLSRRGSMTPLADAGDLPSLDIR